MERFLRFRDLRERGIVNSWPSLTIKIETQGFPPGRKLGPNTRAWTESEITAWVDSRPSDRKPFGGRAVAHLEHVQDTIK